MNDESVLFTKSSRSLETRPLRAFIIISICSFIACISVKIGGGAVSMREGMLKFRRSGLLGSLLPSGFSSPPRLELSPSFPLESRVLRLFDVVVPLDHDSVS